MKLEIITPDRKVFEGQVDVVTLPGINGSFQVLKDHAAMVSTLAKGTLTADKQNFMVEGGVVEVLQNKVLVLAEAVQNA
jgi:F-type H+-transporting ATPase subunit epsilon